MNCENSRLQFFIILITFRWNFQRSLITENDITLQQIGDEFKIVKIKSGNLIED